MSTQPKPGSLWVSIDGTRFRVIDTVFVESDNHTWVHYIKLDNDTEYSCFVESFLHRFTPTSDSIPPRKNYGR